ncbi:hypothetical protein P152DRAFT_481906 [Eremomyces bilateralis CBS 781.70]|uniref:WD40 repeat-like protein n=1 Tax=Eremomyces bilateralis CBS 781.70 TaxID=1392243 RepID=A0A6G1G4Q4_9PEZI|nr:uncharacterized protein P152DRAFT_481906 [Eremomyces bilateralis CBS 781.70]KAF1813034.1 hypothetical protein P152DRAFT_481906 [Eremomyces bilateralis CBS 781.70]
MPVRKSVRASRSNVKYSNDVFHGLDIFSSESENDAIEEDVAEITEEDEPYDVTKEEQVAASEEEDEYHSDGIEDGSVSDASEGKTDGLSIDGSIGSGEKREESKISRMRRKGRSGLWLHDRLGKGGSNEEDELHVQGLLDPRKNGSRHLKILLTWGTGDEDLVALNKARDQWHNQFIWPLRQELHQSFYYSIDQQRREATEGWRWYYERGGAETFKEQQRMISIDAIDGRRYLPKAKYESLPILMGPVKSQKLFDIQYGQSMPLGDAWGTASESGAGGPTIDTSPSNMTRNGWILNIGARIHCLEWVPHHSGNDQYILVSAFHTAHEHTQQSFEASVGDSPARAFAPQPPYSSSFQIWQVPSSSSRDNGRVMNSSQHPRLKSVFCFEWGTPRQLKWCPMQRSDLEIDPDASTVDLGFLAGVWSDGCVRVLTVCIAKDQETIQFVRLESAVFESRPPDTVCTCVAWLSPKCLAVGCANGYVAIWDLSNYISSPFPRPAESVRPFFYHPVHQTYVQHVVSLHPSRPNLLASASMSGYYILTDLSKCQGPSSAFASADQVTSQRSRFGHHVFAFQDVSQSLVLTDENHFLKAVPIRRVQQEYRMVGLGSPALDLATTPLHLTVLSGCADGFAIGTTIFDRLQEPKAGTGAWKSMWFKHEWRDGLQTNKKGQDVRERGLNGAGTNGNAHKDSQAGDSQIPHLVLEDEQSKSKPSETTATQKTSKASKPKKKGFTRQNVGRPGDPLTIQELPVPNDGPGMDGRWREELLKRPMSRFIEGFKPEKTNIVAGEGVGFLNQANGVLFSTIYEEETAVTRVSWNPNLKYGTWAAAGMGSGLVRVEDLAVD